MDTQIRDKIIRISTVLIIILFVVVAIVAFCGEEKTTNESLTNTETKFIGKWNLTDITVISSFNVGQSVQKWYPASGAENPNSPSNEKFNEMCVKYWNKTYLKFENKKSNKKMVGVFSVNSYATFFDWCELNKNGYIYFFAQDEDFRSPIKINSISGKGLNSSIKTVYVNDVAINFEGKLCFTSISDHTIIYIFTKE